MVNPNNNRDKKKEHFYETNNGRFLIGVIILLLIILAVYLLIKSCDKKAPGTGTDSATSSAGFAPLTQTPGSPTSAGPI
jgi:hypothetical protein